MRRLALLALLTLSPSLAEADGLPGTVSYPHWGCTSTGFCFTSAIVEVGYYGYPTPNYVANTQCTQSPTGAPCGYVIDRRVYFYDASGQLIFRYGSGISSPIENARQPVFGVLEINPWLEGADRPAPREMILLTTPEPGSIALVGTGLLTLAGVARRRRRDAA